MVTVSYCLTYLVGGAYLERHAGCSSELIRFYFQQMICCSLDGGRRTKHVHLSSAREDFWVLEQLRVGVRRA